LKDVVKLGEIKNSMLKIEH